LPEKMQKQTAITSGILQILNLGYFSVAVGEVKYYRSKNGINGSDLD